MTDKGVTIERSPSGLGIGVFSPHLAGSGGPSWEQQQQQQQQQQNALITKLAATPPNRLSRNTDNLDKERRNRKIDDKGCVVSNTSLFTCITVVLELHKRRYFDFITIMIWQDQLSSSLSIIRLNELQSCICLILSLWWKYEYSNTDYWGPCFTKYM